MLSKVIGSSVFSKVIGSSVFSKVIGSSVFSQVVASRASGTSTCPRSVLTNLNKILSRTQSSLSDSFKTMPVGSEVTTTYVSSAYMYMYDHRDSFVEL